MSKAFLTKEQIIDLGLKEKIIYHKNYTKEEFNKIKNNTLIEFDSKLRNFKLEIEELSKEKESIKSKALCVINKLKKSILEEDYELYKTITDKICNEPDYNYVLYFGELGYLEDIVSNIKNINRKIEDLKRKIG